MKTFDIEPRVSGRVTLGSGKRENLVLAGRLAEKTNGESCFRW